MFHNIMVSSRSLMMIERAQDASNPNVYSNLCKVANNKEAGDFVLEQQFGVLKRLIRDKIVSCFHETLQKSSASPPYSLLQCQLAWKGPLLYSSSLYLIIFRFE